MKSKRIIISVLAALLTTQLFVLIGCKSKFFETIVFDSLTEMQAELGPSLLYPSALPENFTPDSSTFTSFFYPDSETWEYSISHGNSTYDEDEARYGIPPGQFAVRRIVISCYEPQHRVPENTSAYEKYHSSTREIEEFKSRIAHEGPDKLLDVEGAEVIYTPHSGLTSGEIPYRYMLSSTQFMNNGILYDISISYYANEAMDSEEFLEYGRDLARFMIQGLLSQE